MLMVRLMIKMVIILLSLLLFEIGRLENVLSERRREKPLILRREEYTEKSNPKHETPSDRTKGKYSLFLEGRRTDESRV